MFRFCRALSVALICVSFVGLPVAQPSASDETVTVESGDSEMNAAIERARETLPVFWEAKEAPKPGQYAFMLKVRIRDGGATEHFWLADIEQSEDGFVGTIDNEPQSVTNVKYRQRYAFPQSDITDWLYIEAEKYHGAFTMRVMLQYMTEDAAAHLENQLAFEPE